VLAVPTVEIVEPEDWTPVDAAVRCLSDYDMAIFTSANGVERFLQRMQAQGHAEEDLGGLQLVAIGPATAEVLRSRGFNVQIVPAAARSASLEGLRVLVPRALKARAVLPDGLRQLGAKVDVVPVYRSIIPPGTGPRLQEAFEERVDLVTFTSSSTVDNFIQLVGAEQVQELLARTVVACIGPITAATATEGGLRVTVLPQDYTVESLHQAVVQYFQAGS
jgi:uroporphyrinogen III methyltransferase/synthase